jgi:hypothetical protein
MDPEKYPNVTIINNTDTDNDKINALESELSMALEILYKHGDKAAQEWLYLNYPTQYRKFVMGWRH